MKLYATVGCVVHSLASVSVAPVSTVEQAWCLWQVPQLAGVLSAKLTDAVAYPVDAAFGFQDVGSKKHTLSFPCVRLALAQVLAERLHL